MDISSLSKTDRDLIITALQSLHRERTTAFNAVLTHCVLNNLPTPKNELFGIDEVTTALRDVGALPVR